VVRSPPQKRSATLASVARICAEAASAGANMAAVTALRVRDEGGQLLLYPVTDYHTPGTPSYEDNAEGYRLTRDTMKWFWAHYLNDEQMGLRRLGTKSSQTLRWRGLDSNF
jgi:acetyl esterase/lipase